MKIKFYQTLERLSYGILWKFILTECNLYVYIFCTFFNFNLYHLDLILHLQRQAPQYLVLQYLPLCFTLCDMQVTSPNHVTNVDLHVINIKTHTVIIQKVARLEIFMVMEIHIVVFWVMTLCSDVVANQYFGGPCCCHLWGEENGGTKGLWNIGILPHHYSVTTQKAMTWIQKVHEQLRLLQEHREIMHLFS